MSAIPTTVATPSPTDEAVRGHPVRRATLVSGAIAAVVTTALAAVADAAGVPLAVDGEAIPLVGFAQVTAMGAVLGGLFAAVLHRSGAAGRHWFIRVTVVLTVLSCLPSIALPPDIASKVVLAGTHVVAAAIIIPALAHQLRR